jgi:hypothetical protein
MNEMKNYYFVYAASSSGGNYVAIFPGDNSVAAFDYVQNHSNSKFLQVREGLWSGSGEFPHETKYVISGSDLNNHSNATKILHDCIPWGMMPMYDLGDTKVEDYEVFHEGQWLPGSYFAPKDILMLKWNKSNNPEDIRKMCQDAIDSKKSNKTRSGNILIGYQSNSSEYRVIIMFNRDPAWGKDFTSSTLPDWLKF